jgi:hypothetical protein
VTFFADGNPLPGTVELTPHDGTPQLFAYLSASLTTSISTPGDHFITATYGGDSNYTSAQTFSLDILVSGSTFTVSPVQNITIATPGQPATASVTLNPIGGFLGGVSISCALPAAMKEATCPTVRANIVDANSVTASVIINTTGPHQVAAIRPTSTGLYGFGVLAGVFLLTVPGLRGRRLAMALVVFALMGLIVSCGGGGGGGNSGHTDPGTPTGTYSVTVTATAPGITQSATFSVTVQ